MLLMSEHLPLRRNQEESIYQNNLEENPDSILLHCRSLPNHTSHSHYTKLRCFLVDQGRYEKETDQKQRERQNLKYCLDLETFTGRVKTFTSKTIGEQNIRLFNITTSTIGFKHSLHHPQEPPMTLHLHKHQV